MADIIDGKAFAARLRGEVADGVVEFRNAAGRAPGLAVVLVGEDPASAVYVRSKHKACVAAGMESFEHRLPADTAEADLLALIDRLNADAAVDGILVQLPLPRHIDEMKVIEAIDPDKDVDGFHDRQCGPARDRAGRVRRLHAAGLPDAAQGPAGRPVGLERGDHRALQHRRQADGECCCCAKAAPSPSRTAARRTCPPSCARADIVVAAVGRPEMVKGDWIKPGATVIDVGINRVPAAEEGKTRLVGDVDFAEAMEVAGAITPVPGGVGPMTIACLLHNTLEAAKRRENIWLKGGHGCAAG